MTSEVRRLLQAVLDEGIVRIDNLTDEQLREIDKQ